MERNLPNTGRCLHDHATNPCQGATAHSRLVGILVGGQSGFEFRDILDRNMQLREFRTERNRVPARDNVRLRRLCHIGAASGDVSYTAVDVRVKCLVDYSGGHRSFFRRGLASVGIVFLEL